MRKALSSLPDKDMEIIEDTVKIQKYVWELIGAAKEEILILVSSAKAFARQENAGSVER